MARKRKKNPADPLNYWVALAALLVGGVAIAAWKNMSDRQKTAALP